MAATLVNTKVFGHAMRSAGESALDFAVFHHPMGHQIVGTVEPRLGGIRREAGARIEHAGQDAQVKLDQRGGVLGLVPAVGHDQRDRLADVTQLLPRKDAWIGMKPQRRDRQGERNAVAGEQGPQIVIGQDRPDAGQGARPVGIHALQQTVGDGAADEGCVQQVRQIDIVDEPSRPAQQLCIFQAKDRSAHQRGGRLSPHCRAYRRTTNRSAYYCCVWIPLARTRGAQRAISSLR
jgi:hypothetical protein